MPIDAASSVPARETKRRDVAALAKSMAVMAPTEFTRDVMSGAAMVLEGRDNPLRLNLFAVSIRIFLDHMMDALAPRDQVEACRWFGFEDGQDKPTRRQRLAYGLHGGFMPEQIAELSGLDVGDLVGEVVDAYRELNKHVHGREDTIVRDLGDQDDIADGILDALDDLLGAARECREEILGAVADTLDNKAIEGFLTETVEKLDIMATHHFIEWVGIDERHIVGIDAKQVEYEVTGSLGVTLQYGSGSDVRNGNGAEMSDEFPISVRFAVPIDDPHNLAKAEVTSDVDTSGWYDNDDETDISDIDDIDPSQGERTVTV